MTVDEGLTFYAEVPDAEEFNRKLLDGTFSPDVNVYSTNVYEGRICEVDADLHTESDLRDFCNTIARDYPSLTARGLCYKGWTPENGAYEFAYIFTIIGGRVSFFGGPMSERDYDALADRYYRNTIDPRRALNDLASI